MTDIVGMFEDLPRPKVGTPAAAPSGDGAPDAGALPHPLLDHAPAHLRRDLARVMAGGLPYSDMTDEQKQAEAARLIKAEDATLAAGTQLDLGGHGAAS